MVREGCPNVVEKVISDRLVFSYQGKTLASMAFFQTHCSFCFALPSINHKLAESAVTTSQSANSLGCITKPADLPSEAAFLAYVREASDYISSRRSRSLKILIQQPVWRGLLFVAGAFLTVVLFPTIIANMDYNRK
jgi:hypothetical protein